MNKAGWLTSAPRIAFSQAVKFLPPSLSARPRNAENFNRLLVVGEAVLGANVIKDIFAGIRDFIGGRSGSYESELKKARSMAFADISEEAARMGANAVVGIDLDYEVMGTGGSIMMVSVSGTAVLAKKI